MKSPIKYYGGKSNMTDILKSYFPNSFDVYVEGFGGGASLLFSKERKGIEVYNDLAENVYSLFKVLSDKELFLQLKEKMDLTFYSEQLRKEFKEDLKGDLSLLDRAYKFLYVNRTSFNGVGGFSISNCIRRNICKSTSDYLSMIDNLPQIHDRLSSVVIEHKDIFDLLDKYDFENVFLYLDPPYVKETRLSNQEYDCEMTDEQHEKMLQKTITMKSKIMVSGYESELYEKYLNKNNGWCKIIFESPNAKSNAKEVLWMNYEKEENIFGV